MSGSPAKYVKFRHRTLLFSAKHSGGDSGGGSRSRYLSSTLGGDRDARGVCRCGGLMGFGGLRFGLLGVFESSLVVLLAVKFGSLDMMCLRHERISSLEIAPQQTPFGFRSSGAGGAAGSESTHARLNL